MPASSTKSYSTHPSDNGPPFVLLCSDAPDWHARQLTAALEKRGCYVAWAEYSECIIECVDGQGRVGLPRTPVGRTAEETPCHTRTPDAVIARCIAGGSLEQITMRLSILHGFRECGGRVFNDAGVIERTVDKAMCGMLLARAGLPVPKTLSCESDTRARAFVEAAQAQGQRTVLKPLFGAQGNGLKLINNTADLPRPEDVGGVYHLQHYIGPDNPASPGRDFRVLVAGDRAVAAMTRTGPHWITNVRQGGKCEAAPAGGELGRLAIAAARALGTDYTGVDLMIDGRGQLQILEVNGVPAWKGLQATTSIDIAGAVAGHIDECLDAKAGLPAPA